MLTCFRVQFVQSVDKKFTQLQDVVGALDGGSILANGYLIQLLHTANRRDDGKGWPQMLPWSELHPTFPLHVPAPPPEQNPVKLEVEGASVMLGRQNGAEDPTFSQTLHPLDNGKSVAKGSAEVFPELDLFSPCSPPMEGNLSVEHMAPASQPVPQFGSLLTQQFLDPEWAYGVPKMNEGPSKMSSNPPHPLDDKDLYDIPSWNQLEASAQFR
ncbi:hypothetical protein PIB30_000370 [Stylosanthes scabra]|uniref:Uncharacterized protein n=1 Tax=Stylosanthes scabra TaxID=79078 RepID=A0ABU6U3R7_9FABA|nr:hypothetical protein [Stylosanthes scabra]